MNTNEANTTPSIERLLELSLELTSTMKVIINRAKELHPEFDTTEMEQRNELTRKELMELICR